MKQGQAYNVRKTKLTVNLAISKLLLHHCLALPLELLVTALHHVLELLLVVKLEFSLVLCATFFERRRPANIWWRDSFSSLLAHGARMLSLVERTLGTRRLKNFIDHMCFAAPLK